MDEPMNDHATVTAVYERDDDGIWLVHLAEEERVHTYGRTFTQAVNGIREAAALWFNLDPGSLAIVDQLPGSHQIALDELAEARSRLAEDQAEVRARTLDAVLMLRNWCGASVRDMALMLNLSYQRVGQLVKEAGASHGTRS
jgi:predicted RNase H-like HicB family nuclease